MELIEREPDPPSPRTLADLDQGVWKEATQVATILLVTPDERLRRALAASLRSHGYDVAEAERGWEALRIAHDPRLDLLVVDLGLEDLPGIEVAARIRSTEQTRHLPILALTAEPTPEITDGEYGIDLTLVTPIAVEAVVLAIQELLEPLRIAVGAAPPADQLLMDLHDAVRSNHITLDTVFRARMLFEASGPNEPYIADFRHRVAELGIPSDAQLEGGELAITFFPTVAEALTLGFNRYARGELFFALLDAYPELQREHEALRTRIEQLELDYLRLSHRRAS